MNIEELPAEDAGKMMSFLATAMGEFETKHGPLAAHKLAWCMEHFMRGTAEGFDKKARGEP